jgi:glycerol transport system ATP-binding protein
MNFFDAQIEGCDAMIYGQRIPLGRRYKSLSGRTQIGIRPEYIQFTKEGGLPAAIKHIEDVGRRRIVHAEVAESSIKVSVPEGCPFDITMDRLRFDPDKINIFVDGWRTKGEAL